MPEESPSLVPHLDLRALDPPGGENRRWECQVCKNTGTWAELQEVPCIQMGTITPEEQLDKWVEGESLCPNTRGECCPDFSCCQPTLLAPREVRESFREAMQSGDTEFTTRACMAFLGGAVHKAAEDRAEPVPEVHIAGGVTDPDH